MKEAKAAPSVLYMAFMFPPLAGPSSRYNLGTIRGLLARGFSPTVITAPEVMGSVRETSRSRALSARQWPRDEYLRSHVPEEVTVVRCSWPLAFQRTSAIISNLLRIPSLPYFYGRGRNQMHETARQALEARDYDLIYSVNGVGVEHTVALQLKRSTGLPWIAEFRDPWIHNCWEWHLIRDRSWHWWCSLQFQRVRRMLNEIVDNADLVIVESPLHADYLVRDFELDVQKVAPLGMGFDSAYMGDVAEGLMTFPTKPVIGFVGRTYGYRSAIKNFVDALRILEQDGYQFTLVSVGGDPAFEISADEAQLRNFLPIDRVDHSRALSIMRALDFGIVATGEQCLPHINSKLWEFLASKLSILAIAPKGGSMDAIIEEGDCGYVLPYDTKSMLPILETALRDYREGTSKRASAEFIEGYSRQTMIAELSKRLEGLL